jgi:hypothetical protein
MSPSGKNRQQGDAGMSKSSGVLFMTNRDLATYLNDHLAGSEFAFEWPDHLKRLVPDSLVGQFAADLKMEIAADRQ